MTKGQYVGLLFKIRRHDKDCELQKRTTNKVILELTWDFAAAGAT